ncbi:MAG TPA: hypothetical protein VHB77_12410, partial [Planctomycetaceae bacterium]|nr:hypothetical protein [Planctomycetaceae bacterium]
MQDAGERGGGPTAIPTRSGRFEVAHLLTDAAKTPAPLAERAGEGDSFDAVSAQFRRLFLSIPDVYYANEHNFKKRQQGSRPTAHIAMRRKRKEFTVSQES